MNKMSGVWKRAWRAAVVAGATLAVCVPASLSLADDATDAKTKELKQMQRAAAAQEAELKAALEGVQADMVNLAVQLQRTNAAIPQAQTKLAQAQDKLAQAQNEHQAVQDRLDVARAQQSHLQEKIQAGQQLINETQVTIGQIARQAYRGGQLSVSVWTLLFDSVSLDEMGMRLLVADTAAQSQNQVIVRAQEANAETQHARARQEALTVRIGALEQQAAQAVAAADAARAQEQTQLDAVKQLQAQQVSQQAQLNANKGNYEAQIAQRQAEQNRIAAQISELNRQSAGGPARTLNGAIFGAPTTSMVVTSPYGWREQPIWGGRLFHGGTDFGVGCGQPVYAAQSGTALVGYNSISGNNITVNHGNINGSNWQTLYFHLSAFEISSGQYVQKGQLIGRVGTTGLSTGCHLHLEIWQNGSSINPMSQY